MRIDSSRCRRHTSLVRSSISRRSAHAAASMRLRASASVEYRPCTMRLCCRTARRACRPCAFPFEPHFPRGPPRRAFFGVLYRTAQLNDFLRFNWAAKLSSAPAGPDFHLSRFALSILHAKTSGEMLGSGKGVSSRSCKNILHSPYVLFLFNLTPLWGGRKIRRIFRVGAGAGRASPPSAPHTPAPTPPAAHCHAIMTPCAHKPRNGQESFRAQSSSGGRFGRGLF